jgi:hypothetical protein
MYLIETRDTEKRPVRRHLMPVEASPLFQCMPSGWTTEARPATDADIEDLSRHVTREKLACFPKWRLQ